MLPPEKLVSENDLSDRHQPPPGGIVALLARDGAERDDSEVDLAARRAEMLPGRLKGLKGMSRWRA
jgi:hypothetical protein